MCTLSLLLRIGMNMSSLAAGVRALRRTGSDGRRHERRFIFAGIACLLACSSSDELPSLSSDPASAASAGAGGAGGSDGPSATGGAGFMIEVGATDGSLSLGFDLSASGAGTEAIGAIEIASDTGTIEIFGAALPAVVYEHQSWPEFGLDLYQLLAVAPDRLYVAWLYCDSDGILQHTYYEGTDGTPMSQESAAGTCARKDQTTLARVSLPAISMQPPEILGGFTVDGAQIGVEGGAAGWITVERRQLVVLPFSYVDCSTECGSPGWWELHALLWSEPEKRLAFGIFYLFTGPPVLLAYPLSLPDLSTALDGTQFEATWSVAP